MESNTMTKSIDLDDPAWIQTAYGTEAAAVLGQISYLAEQIDKSVGRFYEKLMEIPPARVVLDNLSKAEFKHLREAQGRYLVGILSPDITPKQHRKIAVKAGFRHFYVGLTQEVLAESMVLYTDIATTLVAGLSEPKKSKEIITSRLQYDLMSQISAYAQVYRERLTFHEFVARRGHTDQPLDFVKTTLETIISSFHFDIAGIALGGIKNGTYRHQFAMGRVPFQAEDSVNQQNPTIKAPEFQQAWFDEQPMIVNSLHKDTLLPWDFKEECVALGVKSVGLFLMHDLQGAPKGCLLVCGNYPGYFLNENTLHFWQQNADMIGIDLDHMERSRAQRRHRLEDGLHFRQLLAQKMVEMHYQPIVDPKTGCTVKVEALARLNDGGKIVPPGVFLTAFGTNQLRDLFDIGLSLIIDDLSGLSLNCSINLPPEAMTDIDWLRSLPDHLKKMGATPNRISLEILESAMVDNSDVQEALSNLKEAGYSILLDDVGAGESSLLRLTTLPVTGIKIDQSFVRSLQYSFDNLDLILSLRSIATLRGLECVVEGVETENIIDTIGGLNGIVLQGYAFAKPMKATALGDWINRDAEGIPLGPFPKSLYGWYSYHIENSLNLRSSLNTVVGDMSVGYLKDAEKCPLHGILQRIGSDEELEQAHREWHTLYGRFASMIKSGSSMKELWQAMEDNKLELRALVEQKLRLDVENKASD